MSRRQMRKLQELKEKQIAEQDAASPDEDDDDSSVPEPPVAINRFNLLLDNSEDDDGDADVEEEESCNAIESSNAKATSVHDAAPSVRPKKKKKRKKKPKQSKADATDASEDLDEVEASVREVSAMLGDTEFTCASQAPGNLSVSNARTHLLSIDYRYLDATAELQRMFGSEAISTDSRNQRGARLRHQHQRRGARTSSKASLTGDFRLPLSRSHGITMEVDTEHKDNNPPQFTVFRFVHSTQYQMQQYKFERALKSTDPHEVHEMIHLNSGNVVHVDTMLQIAGLFREQEDISYADNLVQDAIIEMEHFSHHQCNLTLPNNVLDYNRQENRAFFISIFYQMMSMARRRCHRAALELCKLLLRLATDGIDPLAVKLVADYYALRCREYQWLKQYFHSTSEENNLIMLPNFAYSVALSCFYLSRGDGSIEAHKSLKSRLLEAGNKQTEKTLLAEADAMLQEALLIFPEVLSKLLNANNIKPDDKVSKHSFFYNNRQYKCSKALNALMELYILRVAPYWKEPQVLTWLQKNVNAVLDRVDDNDPLVSKTAASRLVQYQGLPIPIQRHILLSGMPEMLIHLPQETVIAAQNVYYDVIPPQSSHRSYTVKPPQQEAAASSSVSRGILHDFFATIIPDNPIAGGRAVAAAAAPPPRNANENIEEQLAAEIIQQRDLFRTLLNSARALLDSAIFHEREEEGDASLGEEESDVDEDNSSRDDLQDFNEDQEQQ